MKHLFLHIGMHKTGTSALQKTFFRDRQLLSGHGIHYFQQVENHSISFFSLFTKSPEKYHINRRRGIDTPEKAKRLNTELEREIRSLLAAATDGTHVISGEDLSLLQVPQIPKLKSFLDAYFDTITVISYARPPIAFINSYALQAMKGGASYESLDPAKLAPSYQWRFNKFLEAFGAENVRLKPYLPRHLNRTCIVADFLKEIEADQELYDKLTVERVNQHLSMTAAKLLNLVNQHRPGGSKPGFIPTLSKLDGKPFRLPARMIEKIVADSRWDIDWMKKHFTMEFDMESWDDSNAPDALCDDNLTSFSGTELTKIADLLHSLSPPE